MDLVTELDLPEIDYNTPGFGPEVYHKMLADAREHNWLAHSPLAYVVLDGQSGDFFLRARQTAFPGRQIAEIFGITSGPLYEHIDANILNLTGDKHRRLRSLVGHAFTPRAADRWRPVMREFLGQLWAELDGATSTEFVHSIAKPYPSRTIAAVLGAPTADAAKLYHWSNMVQRQFDIQALATQIPDIERAVVEAEAYVTGLLDDRRKNPGTDLISDLVHAEEQGDKLSREECMNLVLDVLAGGVDTTQSQLAQALRLFAAHPAQWEQLAADPQGLAPRAVHEVLRFEPITPFTARIVLEDMEHRGVLFPAGTIVAVCAERANREQGDGETFDITTALPDGKLWTFGAGQHFCLGVNLARAELEEALMFLAPRMPRLERSGEPVLGGVEGIYGVESLPLRWAALYEHRSARTQSPQRGFCALHTVRPCVMNARCRSYLSSGGISGLRIR
jgi:cytochrome P450